MSLLTTFQRIFGAAETDAAAAIHTIETTATDVEEELLMTLPKSFGDAVDRIKALLSGASDQSAADAKTISDLNAQVSDLTAKGSELAAQVSDLTAKCAGLDSQNASLTQQLADANAQIQDMQSAVLQISPDPAPQGSADNGETQPTAGDPAVAPAE